MVICLSKLWENFEEAKNVAIRESAHVTLCAMLQDVVCYLPKLSAFPTLFNFAICRNLKFVLLQFMDWVPLWEALRATSKGQTLN
jgi:hypothetical protein